MTDMKTIAARAKELRALIEYHSNAYYNADAPEIEDDEYDALMRELRELERDYPELRDENSPTVKVGGAGTRYLCIQCAAGAGDCVYHPFAVPGLSAKLRFSRFSGIYRGGKL